MVRNTRQGTVLVAVMGVIWAAFVALAWLAETHPNGPAAHRRGRGDGGQGGPVRHPELDRCSRVSTTGTSTGAVNSLHDSYTGGAGGITLLNMLLGEVAPGGVGTGLYGILVLAIIAVFLAGLMVGRTPEYLGKKLGRVQVTAASISILAMPALVLLGAGLAIALPGTLDALNNDGAHGFSEVLYAYASAANNNGSAFAGITVTSDFFQATLGLAMLFGRFVPILAVLALAGSLAEQKPRRGRRGHAAHRRRRCSACWSAAPSCSSRPSPSSRPSRWAPSRRLCHDRPTVTDRHGTPRPAPRHGRTVAAGAFSPAQLWQSLPEALRKLDPRTQLRNPVMFVVWVGLGAGHGARDHRARACSRS